MKHALNNMQGVRKIFGQGLLTADMAKETFSKVKKLNKSHLTLILRSLTIMVRMAGK